MIVEATKAHRALGERRDPGDVFHCSGSVATHLSACHLARIVMEREDWATHYGRELRTEPLTDRRWDTVVACLNIWNDRPALEQTLPTWIDHVDALVVADGPYASTGVEDPRSSDKLGAYLVGAVRNHDWHTIPPQVWQSQNEKRTALLQRAALWFPGALLFIVDADEFVSLGNTLHDTPEGDVVWVTVTSPLYRLPYGQPRLIRAQPGLAYRGRHHWLYAGDRLLSTHQYGGTGIEHRLSPVIIQNARGLGHSPARAAAKQSHLLAQFQAEQATETLQGQQSDRAVGAREALRIACCTTYDPGLVGFRLHTALNTTTPHASAFLRRGPDNPFQAPRQYDVDQDIGHATQLLSEAEVVHCHLDYSVPDSLKVVPKALVIHHHGTMYRKLADWFNTVDPHRADLRLVSNLELLSYGEGLHWLPNPVSVARLRRLRAEVWQPSDVFRVSHSPSKRHLKGTDDLLAVVGQMQAEGLPIEAVLIEGKAHSESLRIKAECDACFDSFWLGIQCSGIEAGAMGQPVIAGDPLVASRYLEHVGEVPYTYAENAADLALVLRRMVADRPWAETEAGRVGRYVEQWHDDAAVALRYLDLLDAAIHWRTAKAL